MLYIPKIADYLKILTDEVVKDFLLIILDEYFKSAKEKIHPKQNEEKNLGKVAGWLYSFLATPCKAEKYVKLIEKVPEAKTMIRSSSSAYSMRTYNVKIFKSFLFRIITDLHLNNQAIQFFIWVLN